MTSTIDSTFIFICLYALIKVGTAEDTCAAIQDCIKPVIDFKSITQGMPWAPEAQSLCRKGDAVLDCYEGLSSSRCANNAIRGHGRFVYLSLFDICYPVDEDITETVCANEGLERKAFKAYVRQACGRGLDVKVKDIATGRVTGQELCNYANELQSCIFGEPEMICGDQMEMFLGNLLEGSRMSPDNCRSQWEYTNMFYRKLIKTDK